MKFMALFLSVFLSVSILRAAPLEDFRAYESPFLEIVKDIYDQGPVREYPIWARWIQWEDFKFHPPGKSHILEGDCNPQAVKESILKFPVESEPAEVVKILDRCSEQANLGIRDPLRNVVYSFLFKLKPLEHPLARHVLLHLSNGVTLKGFLALKGDQKKRPLVILRTGIYSSARDFYGERGIFMQLFDSSPFNVLLVENLTGWDFVRRDNHIGFAGFDEGLQNFIIVCELQKPSEPLSKIIESVHMAGVSLGGHGTLFASVLNELNPVGDKKVFSSFTAFCPLIQFEESFKSHLKDPISAYSLNYWSSKALAALKDRYPDLRTVHFIEDFISILEKQYRGPMVGAVDVKIPGALSRELTASFTEGLFWRVNNLVPEIHDVKTPFLLLATKKDRVVPYKINAGRLNENTFPRSNLSWYLFGDGYHCSTPVVYDWAFMSAIFEGHILRNSNFGLHEAGRMNLLPAQQLPSWLRDADWHFKSLHLTVDAEEGVLRAKLGFAKKVSALWTRRENLEVLIPMTRFEIPRREVLLASDMGRAILRRWFYQNLQFEVKPEGLQVHWNEY